MDTPELVLHGSPSILLCVIGKVIDKSEVRQRLMWIDD